MRYAFCFVAVATLVACGGLPKQEELKVFGSSTQKVAEGYNSGFSTYFAVGQSIAREGEALALLKDRQSAPLVVPVPDPSLQIDARRFVVRREALAALAAYGVAVQRAADEGNAQALAAAAERLGGAVAQWTNFVPGAPAFVAPAIRLVGRGAGLALAQSYIDQVNGVITDIHPAIIQIAVLLAEENAIFAGSLEVACGNYEIKAQESVMRVARDRRVSNYELYVHYRTVEREVGATMARCNAFDRLPKALAAMVEAHDALLKDNDEGRRALRTFVIAADDIADVIAAARQ